MQFVLLATAIAVVESADTKFFHPIPDLAALLAMLRPLTGRGKPPTA